MRDKLIELMNNAMLTRENDRLMYGEARLTFEELADYLIAHGVTVQEWIPVSERLPEDVYGKDREQIVVLVRTKSGKVSQCARMADYERIEDETHTKVEWIKNGKFYWNKNKAVTHWMPLPEAPKEVE